jgi:hypothetical protein
MLIQNLFERDITRDINGVVKADQTDAKTIWQELEEFVVTKELDRQFRLFFSSYADNGSSQNIGVWVSGFFGSGKSHLIKILSYVLRDQPVTFGGQTKRPVDFLTGKIADAMLLGDMKRAVGTTADVILFNIDSKASHQSGRDAILHVFLKVLNEMQGYSPDHPHVAHMERHLTAKGKLDAFHAAYREATGADWVKERDAYEFARDEVINAFVAGTGQSGESAERWIDNAEGNFALTVENLAKWVKEYLDTKGPQHRIVFAVDEVGQFIGGDSHLMLSLQTITEQLGTVCLGRAWVIVTSQEDIDSVVGEVTKAKSNDFSKIQGRFKTRLSLSSSNVDEVIQSRLLAKDGTVVPELERAFAEKGDIIRNQLTFTNVGMTLKPYADATDFVRNYPFVPYQFVLLQKIFEAIRRHGIGGRHLSRGERSLLDAFQSAAKQIAGQQVGVLVPLYRFYPAIESFLDTAVTMTIEQSAKRSLEPFDVELLKVLFLIRYVEEVKGNVDNLVTLCTDQIDADRLLLRRKIEESLGRLEKETLIARNGDVYSFLTNEEQDVKNEIKAVELTGGEDSKLLGEIIFEDVLKGQRKHRFSVNKMDFPFTRLCDRHPVGNRVENGLVVSVISPLDDDYAFYSDEKCKLESGADQGQALIKLGDVEMLGREVRTFRKTEKYISQKSDPSLPPATKRVLDSFASENRDRRERLVRSLGDLLASARYFVAGQVLTPKAGGASGALDEALEYLVRNTFNKMGLIKRLHVEPLKEIQAVLRTNDIGQLQLKLNTPDSNAGALAEVRQYVELAGKSSKQVVLFDLIDGRFASRPYGWPQQETALLLAQMFALGEISLVMDSAPIPIDRAYEPLTTPAKWRKITLHLRRSSDPKAIQDARNLGKQVFSEMGPDGEEPLFVFLKRKLTGWRDSLNGWKALADTGSYPGGEAIGDGLTLIKPLVADDESVKFIERFTSLKKDLLDLSDDFHDLEHFYTHQKPTWEKLRSASDRFTLNRLELDRDPKAAAGLKRMQEILTAPAPYGLIKEADGLIQSVEAVNKGLVATRRAEALAVVEKQATAIGIELDGAKADAALRASCLSPVQKLAEQVRQTESLAHMAQAEGEALRLFDRAVDQITDWLEQRQQQHIKGGEPQPPAPKPIQFVKAVDLMSQAYIESDADIDAFLGRLRSVLAAALSENKRVQIR